MAKDFFSEEDKKRIVSAIKAAELNTSGEIRVHLEARCKEDVLDRAAYLFEKLQMHKTELRNGVLFYLAYADRKFAILGDGGINEKVPDDFWDEIKARAIEAFKEGDFVNGLCQGIELCGQQLKAHFPYQSDDVNELSDEISFG
jgi:uncharacterized membrane protein